MRRLLVKLLAAVAALLVSLVGSVGAYSYGQSYSLHRGFASVVQLPRAGTGRLLSVNFYSVALHRKADYMIYLPPGYSSATRYPVYYLLHGMPGQPHVFVTIANMDVRLDNQLSLGTLKPMILVYPDGRIGGSVLSDSEWANTSSGSFESYVIEVMHNVDQHFSTLPLRQDRVIAGFSAGAYGAINIALHHLSDFANVQVWSGYFTQTQTGVFAHSSRAVLAYNSPLDYVRRIAGQLAREGLRGFLFVGRDDGSSSQLLPMVRALRARGAAVQYAIYSGGHDWSVWYPRLNGMLVLASHDMGRVPPHRNVVVAPLVARARVSGPRRAHRARVLAPPPALLAGGATHGPQSVAPLGRHHRAGELQLIGALLLSLVSAALINLGFVIQHRGLVTGARAGRGLLASAFRSPVWLSGQLLGWFGFAGQILAVALAPLTLVQAFAAGGLALSVPLAARLFGYRVGRIQLIAIGIIAASLFVLPIGFAAHHARAQAGPFIGAGLLTLTAAAVCTRVRASAARAIAAGACYGVADAAIKGGALALRTHGPGALLSGWAIVAIAATFGGFLSFQSALQRGHAVNAISLMNAFTTLTAIGFGVVAFGEALGTTPAAGFVHIVAIALVLACVWPLARGQSELTEAAGSEAAEREAPDLPIVDAPTAPAAMHPPLRTRALRHALTGIGMVLAVFAVLLSAFVGIGLLFVLRQLRVLAIGPPVPDSLPLLQLAGFDGQPLARVAVAWLLTGLALGLVLIRLRPANRAIIVAATAALALLIASDASYALARNLRLSQVLVHRTPAAGAWVECCLLVAACLVPRPVGGAIRRASARAVSAVRELAAGRLPRQALGDHSGIV